MSDAPTIPRRRFLQFSLRSLLTLVTLAVGLLVAWRVYTEPYRQQRETMALIKKLGGSYKTEAAQKWLRWVYGNDLQNVVLVDVADCDDPQAYLDHVAALPCLETLVVGGHKFSDGHLARLGGLDTLRGLVLDSTNATDSGIASLKEALRDLVVHKSQRRAIAAIRGLLRRPWDRVFTKRSALHRNLRRRLSDKYFEDALNVSWGFNVNDADLVHVRGLSKLEGLDLYSPRVKATGEVDIAAAQVSDAGLRHLKGLTKLRTLSLDATKVSDTGLVHLRGLTDLQALGLSHTQVGDAGLGHLKALKKLRYLNIRSTQVSNAGLAHLRGLSNLRTLVLRDTKVSDAGLAHLKGLTNLRDLWLGATQVSDRGLAHLKGLANLENLGLDGTQVSDAGLAYLEGLNQLQQLLLDHTKVSDAGLIHFKGLTALQWLTLRDTQVTDAGLPHLHGLAKLRWLDLRDTRVTAAGIQKLQKALPNCKVYHAR